MCPVCMASAGMIVASVVSAGGVTGVVAKVLKKKKAEPEDSKVKEK